MAKGKPHMNVVFVGHVDAGKSTTVGRLLFDTGSIDDAAIRKLKEKAEEHNSKTSEYPVGKKK